jgi:hypothetical protein
MSPSAKLVFVGTTPAAISAAVSGFGVHVCETADLGATLPAATANNAPEIKRRFIRSMFQYSPEVLRDQPYFFVPLELPPLYF